MSCPKGYTRRKSYVRTFKNNIKNQGFHVRRKGKTFITKPTQSAIYVPSFCAKNRTPKNLARNGKLRKGDLLKHGYQFRLSDKARHKALMKAIEAYGKPTVYNILDKASRSFATVAPDASMIFRKDRNWVQDQM
jgi:hypothetical protein